VTKPPNGTLLNQPQCCGYDDVESTVSEDLIVERTERPSESDAMFTVGSSGDATLRDRNARSPL